MFELAQNRKIDDSIDANGEISSKVIELSSVVDDSDLLFRIMFTVWSLCMSGKVDVFILII